MWARMVVRDMAFLCVKIVTANMLLSVFFLPGMMAACRYESNLFITTPQTMEALSGSCLQIPCNFSAKPEHEFNQGINFGVWIKNDPFFNKEPENVIYNSSGKVTTYPMNITGNLSQNDCTTLFSRMSSTYEDTYYFRNENKPTGFMATAPCDPVRIIVKDSPQSPSIKIRDDLKEKESVTITCSAFTPCPHSPPKLTWNLQQHSHNNMEENTEGIFTTKIQETITLSDKHDGYKITCSAKYPVNEGKDVKTAEDTKTLNVSYAPKNTSVSISPSGLLSAGVQVNLTCSSRAKPPVSRFTWFKKNKDGRMNVSEGEFYSFNVTDQEVYYCVATNTVGSETSQVICLSMKGPTDSPPRGAVVGAIIGIILLICLVVGLILTFVYWRRLRSAESSQQSLYQTGEELAVEESTRKTEEEDIHYGEIDFSRQKAEPSSKQDSGQPQETLYAQVKVSGFIQAADGSEDLYAQVMKH
uniref:vascular cell adhesion protein 1-like isoform X2 n=1 Tax=Semicossyphus pulcher TaxID=241346 RepID=UPI0037E8D86A